MIRLKEIREKRNLNQDEMAALLHVTRSAYSYYETGKRWPNAETLREMAEALDVSMDYLLGLSENSGSFRELSRQEAINLELYRHMDERGKSTVDVMMVFEQMRFPSAESRED